MQRNSTHWHCSVKTILFAHNCCTQLQLQNQPPNSKASDTSGWLAKHTHMATQNSSSSCGCQEAACFEPSDSSPSTCKTRRVLQKKAMRHPHNAVGVPAQSCSLTVLADSFNCRCCCLHCCLYLPYPPNQKASTLCAPPPYPHPPTHLDKFRPQLCIKACDGAGQQRRTLLGDGCLVQRLETYAGTATNTTTTAAEAEALVPRACGCCTAATRNIVCIIVVNSCRCPAAVMLRQGVQPRGLEESGLCGCGLCWTRPAGRNVGGLVQGRHDNVVSVLVIVHTWQEGALHKDVVVVPVFVRESAKMSNKTRD